MNKYEEAIRRHTMWFGSYTRAGELRKTQVWCFLKDGNIEFLTPGDSIKVNRVGRNPAVICWLGSPDGPKVQGTAELIADPAEVQRGYRAYWKIHPWMMLLLGWSIGRRVRSGKQILVRVKLEGTNPFAGITDPPA